MAPRRSVDNASMAVPAESTSSHSGSSGSALFSDSLSKIEQQVSALTVGWPQERQVVQELLTAEVQAVNSGAASALQSSRLSQVVLGLLDSGVQVDDLAQCLQETVAEWDQERRDILWECLVDVVEVLEESKEDCEDFLRVSEGMEVDGGVGKSPSVLGIRSSGQRGMDLIKSLLVS
jgi:hypothetical protein